MVRHPLTCFSLLQGLDINDYSITAFNNRNQHRFLLHDDLSLDDALRSMSDSHYLELVLQRKRARTLSPPGHLFRRESTMEPMRKSNWCEHSMNHPILTNAILPGDDSILKTLVV